MTRWVRGKPIGHGAFGYFAVCPFCKYEQVLSETMPWCKSCGCEYRVTPCGARFDQSRKTARYAWGKALNLVGGTRLGKVAR